MYAIMYVCTVHAASKLIIRVCVCVCVCVCMCVCVCVCVCLLRSHLAVVVYCSTERAANLCSRLQPGAPKRARPPGRAGVTFWDLRSGAVTKPNVLPYGNGTGGSVSYH